ncbi:LCP family protein [Specibacter cremeus]|uniref:LCP family protein n=1 Tax=Specibacter cremeus TaxID=1629051 RepID=UPI000F7A0BBD|nr:LCP family protein [Specibacter cremeus]
MTINSPKVTRASQRPPVLTDPARHPEAASAPLRTKRAWLLLVMTLVLPGSAQLVAGNRRLGRLALRITAAYWLVVIAVVVLALVTLETLLNLLTNPWTAMLAIVLLAGAALGWAVMFLDTLRLIRPRLLAPGMRGIVCAGLAVLMVATSGTLGYAAYMVNSGRNAISSIFAGGPDMRPVDGRYNFLVLGGDAGAGRSGRRPDSIIVVSVDAKSGQASTISIPRNLQNAQFEPGSPLWKAYPEGYNCGDNCIIDFLYSDVTEKHKDLYPHAADPGAEAMMDAAGGILGLKVQGYVLVDMAGFSQLIDALGGVKVNAGGWVPLSGDDVNGDGHHLPPTGWIHPGEQTLDGYHALWYARSRQWVLEYARSERQQCIQAALLKQMDPATVLTKFNAIADAGTKVIESDIPAGQLGSFVTLAVKAKGHPLKRLTIGPPDFPVEFSTYPDFNVIHQRVQDLLHPPAPKPAAPKPAAPAPTTGNGAAPAAPAPATGNGATPGDGATADGTESTPAPKVTQQYLQQLAVNADDAQLEALLANNGSCTPG